jgi:arabinofuranosyltransferase
VSPRQPRISFTTSRLLNAVVLGVPFLVLAAWVAAVIAHASVSVDGVRYFYLDDGQMVSMRYARNLVEGDGLVWNPGERVEGYSNPGWVLVMAGVHAAGASGARAALYVKLLSGLCAAAVLWSALGLKRRLGSSTLTGEAVLLLSLAMCADVVFWAANGFETTLLTFLLLWLLGRVVDETSRGTPSPWTMLFAGALPIVRADAHVLTVSIVAVAIGCSRAADRRRAGRAAWLAAILPIAHLTVRLAYYGDVLPNTFYLRQASAAGVWMDGARYAGSFLSDYGMLLAVGFAGAVWSRSRTQRWLLAPLAATGVTAIAAGGDIHEHFRVFAPALPIALVLGTVAVERWTARSQPARAAGFVVFAAAAIWAGGMVRAWPVDAMRSWRGKPWQGVVIGRLIERHSRPEASIAAADIGALGYFSRRQIVDLSGRTDPAIAHRPARPGADGAARKFDIAVSLQRRPDFVLTAAPHEIARFGEIMFALSGVDPARDLGPALLANATFQQLYRGSPVPLEPLLRRSAVYVRRDSPERASVGEWTMPAADF